MYYNQDGWSTGSAQSVRRWCLAQPGAWSWCLGCQSYPACHSLSSLHPCTYRLCFVLSDPIFVRLTFVSSVADVSQDSGVGGEAGLRAGDILLAIQGRKIANLSAYRSCISFSSESLDFNIVCLQNHTGIAMQCTLMLYKVCLFQGSASYADQRRRWWPLC